MTDTDTDTADAVVVAYVHSNDVTYSWHHSMVEMIGWDMANAGRIVRGGWIAIRYGTDGIAEARNKAVRIFLDEKRADWLFWIDTDMGFAPDTIDQLLQVADPKTRPIVGGLAFSQRETDSDGMGGWRCTATPTIFDWVRLDNEQMGYTIRWGYPADTVVRCAGTGAACILIHRSVFERLEEKYGRVWYDRVPNTRTGQIVSEDLAFCLRAGAENIPVHVHTGVKTTHQKMLWLAEDDYISQASPPPATEPVTVIVPVMQRPQNAAPFMQSLRASTGLATVYAVADHFDTATRIAWRDAGATIIEGPAKDGNEPGSFAEKVNAAYKAVADPWLFICGDDVRFHSGWFDHAVDQAGDKFHVIGTNDLANPRVVSGDHGTHLLIRRAYVAERGSSWDGPNVVAHEGYRHWYVDDEIVAAAKQRGVWTSAHSSIVEHLHPMVAKADMDDVYRLGQSFAETDREVFTSRCATYM